MISCDALITNFYWQGGAESPQDLDEAQLVAHNAQRCQVTAQQVTEMTKEEIEVFASDIFEDMMTNYAEYLPIEDTENP